jgi:hypothetical protein
MGRTVELMGRTGNSYNTLFGKPEGHTFHLAAPFTACRILDRNYVSKATEEKINP